MGYVSPTGYSAGAFNSQGATAITHGKAVPILNAQSTNPFAAGGYGGAGLQLYATNAGQNGAIAGDFTQYNVNIGLGPVNFGMSYGTASNGIWFVSFTVPAASFGGGVAVSKLTTYTEASGAVCQ